MKPLSTAMDKSQIELLIRSGDTTIENDAAAAQCKENGTTTYEYKLPTAIRENAATIDDKLADIRVCDPAVGSGAFIVGMMNEIVRARLALARPANRNHTPYQLKRHAIQNCLYGVDFDPGAVEIAKLRLWLSLVVDEEDRASIKPLPNLDYKIMQGNSLLDEYHGVKLFDDSILVAGSNSAQAQIEALEKQRIPLQREYFDLKFAFKEDKLRLAQLEKELKQIADSIKKLQAPQSSSPQNGLWDGQNTARDKAEELKRLHVKFFGQSNAEDKKQIKAQIENLGWELIEASLKEQGKDDALAEVAQFKENKTKPFFLWNLNFWEVFVEKGGFDVVIGNPPYISAVEHARSNSQTREAYRRRYPVLKGAFDVYVVFLLKSVDLTHARGSYAWIIPNKFMVSKYSEDVLAHLKRNGLYQIVSVSSLHVFENTSVYPIILQGHKPSSGFAEMEASSISDLGTHRVEQKRSLGHYLTLQDFGVKVASGTTGFQAQQVADCLSERPTDQSMPFVVSGAIDKYTIQFDNIRYMGSVYSRAYVSRGSGIAKSKWDFWQRSKIVVAGMTKEIEAVYWSEPLALGVGCYAIYEFGKFDPYFLTALLNSKFISYYLAHRFRDKHLAGGYLAINKSTIEALPLVEVDPSRQQHLAELSKLIMSLTSASDYSNDPAKQAEVKRYMREIDGSVYELYQLAPEEIALVEGTTTAEL